MFSILSVALLTLSLFTILPHDSKAADVKEDKCFVHYAKNGWRPTGARYVIEDCIELSLGIDPDSSNGGLYWNQIKPKLLSASEAMKKDLSQKASKIYYNNDFCKDPGVGRYQIPNTPRTSCDEVFRVLAQLHPSGMYHYTCPMGSPAHCKTHAQHIAIGLKDCNKDTKHRIHCDTLVKDFLTSPKCSASAKTNDCKTYVAQQSTSDTCGYGNYDKSICVGPTDDAKKSSVAGDGNPNESSEGGAEDPGNPVPEALTSEDAKKLEKLLPQVAQSAFGGLPFDSRNNTNARLQVPKTNLQAPSAAAMGGGGYDGPGGTGYNPGSNTALPAIADLAVAQEGSPGGTPKGGGQAGSPGASGGGGVGGQGVRPGGTGGGGGAGKKARRGRRSSRFKKVASSLGRFKSADGAIASAGAPVQAESAVDKKVREQLKRNREQGPDNQERIRNAFNQNLNRGISGQSLILKASYFPDHKEVYLELNQTNDVIDETDL